MWTTPRASGRRSWRSDPGFRRPRVTILSTTGVRDLGDDRLKDFEEPVAIYQVGNERFPPLETIDQQHQPAPSGQLAWKRGSGLTRDGTVALACDALYLSTADAVR